MDVNKLRLYVGLTALALTLPLSVIANLITPAIRDWYSTRSQKKLRERIGDLETRLTKSEKEWTFTPAEWAICQLTRSLTTHQFLTMHVILSAIGLVLFYISSDQLFDLHVTLVRNIFCGQLPV